MIVKSGTYNEDVFIPKSASGSPGKYVTFKSEVPRGAKIKAQKTSGILSFASYSKIEGFEVIGGGLALEQTHHAEVRNNVVHGSPKGGITIHRSDFTLVKGNVTYGNASSAATSGISIHVPQNITNDSKTKGFRIIVRDNISYNNVQTKSGSTDGNGIIFDDFLLRNLTSNNDGKKYLKNAPWMKPYRFPGLIENNIVYGNGGAGIRVYATDNITVRNNTAYHNGTDPDHRNKPAAWLGELQSMSGSNNVWVNNIGVSDVKINKNAAGISSVSFKNWPSKNVTWMNNLTYTDGKPGDKSAKVTGVDKMINNKLGVNPQFINPPSNFRLKSGSAAINAGTLQHGSSNKDSDGGKRVNKTIDIGAFEN